MNEKKLRLIVSKIKYKDWKFTVATQPRTRALIVTIGMPARDAKTGKPTMVGMQIVVWEKETRAQIVERVYSACVRTEQHEVSELFSFNGKRIYNEHGPQVKTLEVADVIGPRDPGEPMVPISTKLPISLWKEIESLSLLGRRSRAMTVSLVIRAAMHLNGRVISRMVTGPKFV